ncbi:MAG: hypothetical protein ACQEVA_08100 [Myxococcota bacterium]
MKTRALFILAVALMLTIPQMASAQQVPAEVPIQAFLADDNGVPVDGTVTVRFGIYDDAVGGNELHNEEVTLDADAGAFTAYITPDLSIFQDNQELYLGLAVDGGSEMSPRLQMATVPYAAVAGTAADAATLDGMSSSDFAPSDYQPDWSEVENKPAGLDASCASDEILKWDGSAWACAADENATYAAGDGLSLSGSDFSADYSQIQSRVADSCGTGEYITGINQDGTVMCAADQDTDTTYDAGNGLALNGTTFSADDTYFDGNYYPLTGGVVDGDVEANGHLRTDADGSAGTSYLFWDDTGAPGSGPRWYYSGGLDTFYMRGAAGGFDIEGQFEAGGDIIADGNITINDDTSPGLSYLYFADGEGSTGPRMYHRASDNRARFDGISEFYVGGDTGASGTKNFIQPHSEDPTKQIRYTSLEGGETGVYTRGSARTTNGRAVIDLPEHFRVVASPKELTTNLTLKGGWAPLYVEEVTPTELVVAVDDRFGDEDVEFDYTVNGVRKHFEDRPVVEPNTHFLPDEDFAAFAEEMRNNPEIRAMLIENGLLNADGSVNEAVAEQLVR